MKLMEYKINNFNYESIGLNTQYFQIKRKMRTALILFFLFISKFNSICQNIKGTVEYYYKVDESFINDDIIEKEKSQSLKNTLGFLNASLKNNQNKLKFILKFNKSKSMYSMDKVLNIDIDKQLKYAIITTGGDEIYYQELEEKKTIFQTVIFGEEFNVFSYMDSLQWELTREKKKIGKYNCLKAIAILKNKRKVEAWFTPEIPVSFGPKGFGGLPGLILELKENNIIFYPQKVILNQKKDIEIELPKKENTISLEKFNSLNVKAKSSLKKMTN